MKKSRFRYDAVERTCTKQKKQVQKYRKALSEDFHGHCGYCNLNDKLIAPLPFQIDHFVPRAEFKGKRDGLETDYRNFVYSCPKCNRAKGRSFKGDISKPSVDNELYYDPGSTEMNQIFYRDEMGSICSDDIKGQDMIRRLKLKHPIHNSAWLAEELEKTYREIGRQMEKEKNEKRAELLRKAYDRLSHILLEQRELFRESYYPK